MGDLTHEEFVRILGEIIDEEPATSLLLVPGVWEVLSEHFNNDVIDRYRQESGRS